MNLSVTTQAKLVAKDAPTEFRELPLSNFPLRIGRSDDCDVCVDDRWVSRDHCEIRFDDDHLVIRDLGSKYGTYVNGQQVSERVLEDNDELSIGLSRFTIRIDSSDSCAEADVNLLA